MSKPFAAGVLAWLWISVVAVVHVAAGPTIDLNQAGALEALQLSNPAHYEKVRKILDGILHQPDAAVPRWIQTNFNARNVSYMPVLMTSDPPKRRLSFALDEARYEVVLTLTNIRAEIVPLK